MSEKRYVWILHWYSINSLPYVDKWEWLSDTAGGGVRVQAAGGVKVIRKSDSNVICRTEDEYRAVAKKMLDDRLEWARHWLAELVEASEKGLRVKVQRAEPYPKMKLEY